MSGRTDSSYIRLSGSFPYILGRIEHRMMGGVWNTDRLFEPLNCVEANMTRSTIARFVVSVLYLPLAFVGCSAESPIARSSVATDPIENAHPLSEPVLVST